MTTIEILKSLKTLAVVGLSDNPTRTSYLVSKYMLEAGYKIIPINPNANSVFGIQSYPSLSDMPPHLKQEPILVNVFRKSEDVPPIVDEAIAIGAKGIWLQLGITHQTAIEKAKSAGLVTVQNRCIMVEHQYL
ncbi:MAG: CoA-binding protein [Chloroherpetonaceae bacterium]|nr:CoA-binding protein [Chloroherpetonaceae bacterium]